MKDFGLSQGLLTIFYYRYKSFWVPFLVVSIAVGVFLGMVVPQFQEYLIQKEEEEEIQTRIEILQENIKILSSMNKSEQDEVLDISSQALSPEKDFAGILYSISNAAVQAGVSLQDFTFQVGDITGSQEDAKTLPALKLTVSINSDIRGAERFLKNLAMSLPISEGVAVDVSRNNSQIAVVFYFKPFPSSKIALEKPIQPLSQNETVLVSKLRSWQNNSIVSELPATSSAPLIP